jgi:hypothetical protein
LKRINADALMMMVVGGGGGEIVETREKREKREAGGSFPFWIFFGGFLSFLGVALGNN